MNGDFFNCFTEKVYSILSETNVTYTGEKMPIDRGIDLFCELADAVSIAKKTLFVVGNGTSAAVSSQISANLSKNSDVKAFFLNEPALMSAIANDIAFDQVFSLPINKFGKPDDLLISISSSGTSANIVNAVEASSKNKMKIITLTGGKEENPCRMKGMLNFYVPSKEGNIVETCHQLILQCWLSKFFNRPSSQ